MIKRILTALVALSVCGLGFYQVGRAQSGVELLQDPSFETYYSSGGLSIPDGWKLNLTPGAGSSGHKWPGESRSGSSWDVSAHSQTFTMVGYQFVPGVQSGSKLRFSAWANIYTCNRQDSCIEGNRGYRVSDQSSGSRVRIGSDPNGGTDPNASSVVWSNEMSPWDQFQQLTIDFTSTNGNGVTVFLYATQTYAMLLNHVYWDDASLQVLQAGQGGPSANSTPAPQFAPLVRTQATQPDGSILHVVQAGDTLSSIAYAYKVTVKQIRDLNHMQPDDSLLSIGQKLLIKGPDTLLASGAATGAATDEATPSGTEAESTASFGSVITLVPTNTLGSPLSATIGPVAGSVDASDASAATPTPLPTVAPINQAGAICVTAFDDANLNHWQDADEKPLAGLALALSKDGQAGTINQLTTTADKPSCFNDVAPGSYAVSATAPTNYGLTTAGQLVVEVKPGAQLTLTFGAAQGYHPTPATIALVPTPPAGAPSSAGSVLDTLAGNSGLIVFGLAGLVLVGGLGLALVLRGR